MNTENFLTLLCDNDKEINLEVKNKSNEIFEKNIIPILIDNYKEDLSQINMTSILNDVLGISYKIFKNKKYSSANWNNFNNKPFEELLYFLTQLLLHDEFFIKKIDKKYETNILLSINKKEQISIEDISNTYLIFKTSLFERKKDLHLLWTFYSGSNKESNIAFNEIVSLLKG